MVLSWQQSSRYTQIPSGIEDLATNEENHSEESEKTHPSSRLREKLSDFSKQALLGGFIAILILAGIAGFALGALVFRE